MYNDDRSYQKSFLIDMDGVINKGRSLIPGAKEFVETLQMEDFKFLFLTNNSYYTANELKNRLDEIGVSVAIEGDIAVVGAWQPGINPGKEYVFEKGGASWSNMTQTAIALFR